MLGLLHLGWKQDWLAGLELPGWRKLLGQLGLRESRQALLQERRGACSPEFARREQATRL